MGADPKPDNNSAISFSVPPACHLSLPVDLIQLLPGSGQWPSGAGYAIHLAVLELACSSNGQAHWHGKMETRCLGKEHPPSSPSSAFYMRENGANVLRKG